MLQACKLSTYFSDVIKGAIASQIISLTIVYLTVYSAQIKENIKAPRHWLLCRKFTGDRRIPRTNGHLRENVSIGWRHHVTSNLKWCCINGKDLNSSDLYTWCVLFMKATGRIQTRSGLIRNKWNNYVAEMKWMLESFLPFLSTTECISCNPKQTG